MEKIGEELKYFFKEKGISQSDIANKLGTSQAYISSLLNDKQPFGKKQAKRWQELFGLSQTWLLTGDGDMLIGSTVQNNQNGDNINGNTALINTNIYIKQNQWNADKQIVVNHPRKQFYNCYLAHRKLDIETELMKLSDIGLLAKLSITDIRALVIDRLDPDSITGVVTFIKAFADFTDSKKKTRTHEIYRTTLEYIKKYDSGYQLLSYEDITPKWLTGLNNYLSSFSPSANARNIHLRNIRDVFNYAIDEGYTTYYPFRKFKIRPVATAKRAMTLDNIRRVFDFRDSRCQIYIDFFKLSFLLIGMNTIDLCSVKKDAVVNGRLEYNRAKTGRLYSIKLEPEAMTLIDKYRDMDRDNLLIFGKGKDRYTSWSTEVNSALHYVSKIIGIPNFSMYWARHTWATLAAELDIPKETISASLGHGSQSVTDIYIDFDAKKVDEANRRVLDYVFQ